MLDLAGLVSPEIVPFILDEEPLWRWLQERDARYLMAFPDQVPGDDVRDPHLCPVFTTANRFNCGGRSKYERLPIGVGWQLPLVLSFGLLHHKL